MARSPLWLALLASSASELQALCPRARLLGEALRAPAASIPQRASGGLQPLAPRARALTRLKSDGERSYDGVDLGASDATDVMDEEGWFEDDDPEYSVDTGWTGDDWDE